MRNQGDIYRNYDNNDLYNFDYDNSEANNDFYNFNYYNAEAYNDFNSFNHCS